MARISNLGLPASEVDSIMLSLFGNEAKASAPTTPPVQSVQAPNGQAFIPVDIRQMPVKPVFVAPPVKLQDTVKPLLPAPVAAKKASSGAGLALTGAAAGLLVGGPVGAAVGAGAGFLLSKLGKK